MHTETFLGTILLLVNALSIDAQPTGIPQQKCAIEREQPADGSNQIMRGTLSINVDAGTATLTLCAAQDAIALEIDPGTIAFLMEHTASPEFYIETDVAYHAPDYYLSEISYASTEIDPCNQPTWRINGTEPFWQLTYQDGWQFDLMGEITPMQVERIEQSTGHQLFVGNNGNRIHLNQGDCSDGMSDSIFTWQAEVVVDGQTYKGCAILPVDMPLPEK
ncbi:hypothetical protein VST7929_02671 [Vibrio stylophorae]|uniref:Lipoprotein n=1 Tax=Vibrio stylophorae TaxID=659351 RepID=A0ABN8DUK7_9VIBR|nr:hypothetical protein [Vibrio stylophorae]CAH0534721.1 hypothetical protein VST7929_02671 [Vibrio stylophorae]